MITFFEKLANIEGKRGGSSVTRYLRTHPATGERIARLRALAAAAPRLRPGLLPDDDWDNVKTMCGQ
jgi:predicted Zn-dependent protease